MHSKKNVKPEIAWSQFRRRFAPGFENILKEGVIAGWYNTTRPLDVWVIKKLSTIFLILIFLVSLVFRWLFIPWLQLELDAYVERVNNNKKWAIRDKVLPHGAPNDIFNSPGRYGCLDFKASIENYILE